MYIFVVLIQVVVMMSFLPDGPFSALNETFRYLVANLLFANFLQHDISGILQSKLLEPTLNPSLWTLKIELGFYLIAPAVFAAVRRWGGGVLVAIFVASALFELVGKHLGYDQYARQLPGQMQFFAVGIAIYYYAQRIRVNTLLAMMAPIVFVALWTWCWPIPAGVRPLIVGAFVFCFALRMPVLPVGSDLSYSVYLQHGPLNSNAPLFGLVAEQDVGALHDPPDCARSVVCDGTLCGKAGDRTRQAALASFHAHGRAPCDGHPRTRPEMTPRGVSISKPDALAP